MLSILTWKGPEPDLWLIWEYLKEPQKFQAAQVKNAASRVLNKQFVDSQRKTK